jgi:hypothetical protein
MHEALGSIPSDIKKKKLYFEIILYFCSAICNFACELMLKGGFLSLGIPNSSYRGSSGHPHTNAIRTSVTKVQT